MPKRLGLHAPRIAAARALLAPKGRRDAECFLFEGATLLAEAQRSGLALQEIFATEAAYEETPMLQDFEARGVPLWLVEERAAHALSDVATPSGIVAVAKRCLQPLPEMLARPGLVLALADLGDPGNAGTLLRSAEAFSVAGVVFGRLGVDPYHPKVVRSAMGSLFRLAVALCGPEELGDAAREAGLPILGLDGKAMESIAELPARAVLVVGQERHGLGRWAPLCERLLRVPSTGSAESLNAAVAGSIALYQASVSRSR